MSGDYVTGLTLVRHSANAVKVNAGEARDSTNAENIVLASTQTANITVSGAGGLDTGSEAPSTWYAIHAIDDTSGTNAGDAMLSLSATAPTMPSSYDVFRHVGWVYNDAGSSFMNWFQSGVGKTRKIRYEDTFSKVRILNKGSATSLSDADCSGLAPPGSSMLTLRCDFETGSSGSLSDYARVARKGAASTGPVQLRPGNKSSQVASWIFEQPCDSDQVVQYLVTDGVNNQLSIGVVGFEYDI